MPQAAPEISIVLGTYERLPFLKLAIDSIRRELENFPSEIIVVDGGSGDGTVEWLVGQKDILTIIQHNHGEWKGKPLERRSWGYFMNLAMRSARGKYICMLSDDCLVIPGAIRNGYALFEKERSEGKKLGSLAFYWRNGAPDPIYYISLFAGIVFVNHGMFLASALYDVGYADEENFDFYYGDVDLCLKLAGKGYLCEESPDSYIEHYPHVDPLRRAANEKSLITGYHAIMNKWQGMIDFDGHTRDTIQVMRGKRFVDHSQTFGFYREALKGRSRKNFMDGLCKFPKRLLGKGY